MSEQQLVLAERMCRSLMRLFGPRVAAAQDERFTVAHCDRCTPPPQMWTCPICEFTTPARWQYTLHLKINPETCQRVAQAWVRNWAAKT